VLLACSFVGRSRRHDPTIDMSLFRNRHFSAGVGAIGVTFFALMGATFYWPTFCRRCVVPALAAGVALIAVAGAVMVAALWRLGCRAFRAAAVTGWGWRSSG